MPYRAQFPIATPAGFRDEPYEYFYDDTTIAALNFNLQVGQVLIVYLQIDVGPDFLWRGTTITPAPGQTVGVQFADADGNFLSSDFEPIAFYQGLNVDAVTNGSLLGELNEPEIRCPGGSVVQMRIQRLS